MRYIKTLIIFLSFFWLAIFTVKQGNKLFDYYLNALGKDGVSYELIEKSLPMIEGEVNNILGQIVDFGMQLEIDGKKSKGLICDLPLV